MDKAKYIDHTNLKAFATTKDIIKLCSEANYYHFKSVCVNPANVSLAHDLLRGSDVLVCTVIGFPLGANTSDVKTYETTRAIADGADEIDMVINIGKAKEGDWDYVRDDIKAVVDAANGCLVKVIIETLAVIPGTSFPSLLSTVTTTVYVTTFETVVDEILT